MTTYMGEESIMHVQEIIRTHPHVRGSTNDALIRCIEACYDCAVACTACADACLGEPSVQQLTQCIRLNLDCADVCAATGAVATRRTGSNEEIIQLMLQACAAAWIGMKLGRKITWDVKSESFVNDAEANALRSRKARAAEFDIDLVMKKAGL